MATTTQWGREWRAARQRRGWTQEDAAQALGVSPATIRAIEQGSRKPGPKLQRIATILGVPAPQDSDRRGGGPPPDPRAFSADEYEAQLRAYWALFYAGKAQEAADAVAGAIRSLDAHGGAMLPLLGRFQQLAGVLARDDKRLMDAITSGAASVEIARQGQSPDHLASALFRLARTYQQADQHAVAVHTMDEAHKLAPHCRQPLAGWLKLSRVEIESRAQLPRETRLPLPELRRLIDQAHADLANRPGEDDSFTLITRPGIWHIEVQALLSVPGYVREARDLIRQAIAGLQPDQHRWRYGMLATEALAYALSDDAEAAATLAEEVLALTRSASHLRHLRRGLAHLERNDPHARNPHVVRFRRLMGAA